MAIQIDLTKKKSSFLKNSNSSINTKIFEKMKQMLKKEFPALIAAFYQGVDDIIKKQASWQSGDDTNELLCLFDNLKSSSDCVGALTLSQLAEKCEQQVRGNAINEALAGVEGLNQEYQRVIIALDVLGYKKVWLLA